jgi:hypothetical protein
MRNTWPDKQYFNDLCVAAISEVTQNHTISQFIYIFQFVK